MKKCIYCGKEIPKKDRKWMRVPISIMDDNNLVCKKCKGDVK